MNAEMREIINNLTEDIITQFGIKIPIDNIDDVVEKLGGRIVNTTGLAGLGDGCVCRSGEGFIIQVVPYQSEERKKFTVAHELGHLFLHMGYLIDEELWENQKTEQYYRNGTSAEEEYQANEFAAALLMPKKKYKEIMDKYTEGNIVYTARIAEEFGVSVAAASNRGKFLGYLKW